MTIYNNKQLDVIDLAHRFSNEILKKSFVEKFLEFTPDKTSFTRKQIKKCADYLKIYDIMLPKARSGFGRIVINIPANEVIESLCNALFPALSAGNTVLLRPSSRVVEPLKYLVHKMYSLGLSTDRVEIIDGSRDAFASLISSGTLDMVYWTGGSGSAKEIMGQCMQCGVHCVVESEGNDLCYVDENADIDLAVAILQNSLNENNGEMCNAIRGVFVHNSVKDKLVNMLDIKVASNTQKLSKEVIELIKDFKCQGDGTYAIITNPSKSLVESNDEIFAPVQWIFGVSSYKDCETIIEQKKHKLGFICISKDKMCIQWAKNLCVPQIFINSDPLNVSMTSTWGGIKKSGSHGPQEWIEKFSFRKIVIQSPQEE